MYFFLKNVVKIDYILVVIINHKKYLENVVTLQRQTEKGKIRSFLFEKLDVKY
jgi:hypothetical protein